MSTAVASPPTAAAPRQVPLPPVFPFACAVAHGQDRCGLWQAFDLNGVRQRLRWVPPGDFMMGSPLDESDRANNEGQHRVTLTQGFWLADTACTQALWQAVIGDNPSHFKGDVQCPVESVAWTDVVEKFLPLANSLLPDLDLRLPTEAEWEYACREAGAATGPYCFGRSITPEQVNYDDVRLHGEPNRSLQGRGTVPVRALPANALGLHQMHGNLWEWVHDWFGPYAGDAQDPVGTSKSASIGQRVVRGGTWRLNAHDCRSARRTGFFPSNGNVYVGFRLACGALPPSSPAVAASSPMR